VSARAMKPPALAVVPTLDAILRQPSSVEGLAHEALTVLLAQAAAVQGILASRLIVVTDHATQIEPAEPDEQLTVAECAAKLRKSSRWVWRNADRLPFVKRMPGSRSMLISRKRLETWLTRK
jgi:hypothetical protein